MGPTGKKFFAVAAVLASAVTHCGWGLAADEALYDRGKQVFNTNCRVCHILKSEGDQPSPYYLRFRPGDFSNPDFWKNHNDRTIEDAVKRGKGAMPPQHLAPAEIRALIHFMNVEFKGQP